MVAPLAAVGPGLFVAIRTIGLDLMLRTFGIELKDFHNAQFEKMRQCMKILAKGVRRDIRDGVEVHTRSSQSAVTFRIKRIGQAEFSGRVHYRTRKKGFYALFLDMGRKKGPPLPARLFMERTARKYEQVVMDIMGESYRVFSG